MVCRHGKMASSRPIVGPVPTVRPAASIKGVTQKCRKTWCESAVAHDSDAAAYRCPKCGATSALLLPPAGPRSRPLPAPALRDSHVALKCLQCAHVVRVPRHVLESGGARSGSAGPLD